MEQIVTGEAIVLDLPCARFPARILSRIIDMAVELLLFFIIAVLVGLGEGSGTLDSAMTTALIIAGLVLATVGYPVVFETLSRGRTLGKLALGLRVVADDGGPERFRHAFVRGLVGFLECWLLFGVPALITSILSARGKRLGDVFAGTFVLRERAPRSASPAYLGVPAPGMAGPGAVPYAAGRGRPRGRDPDRPGTAAVGRLAGPVRPPGCAARRRRPATCRGTGSSTAHRATHSASSWPPMSPPAFRRRRRPAWRRAAYLHSVLAERRNRELARLMPWSRTP